MEVKKKKSPVFYIAIVFVVLMAILILLPKKETKEEEKKEEKPIETVEIKEATKEEPIPEVKENPVPEVKEEPIPEPEKDPVVDSSLPITQQQAIKSAIDYIDYKPFSRLGLIGQLSSEYGDGFSKDDAVFAVDYLEQNNLVDWSEQAAKSAQDYIDYKAFSRKGLVGQLSSEYGDQFTPEEAEYGVKYLEDNNLVDWKEQAAKAAKDYLDYDSFSKDGLIDQLSSQYGEQFTREEAEYGAKAVGF